jgi:hypothetical protein
MKTTKIICIATLIAFAGASQASAGGLLGILSGNKTGVGGIVIAPSVDVGDILSGNKNNKTSILNDVLSGNLNGVLSGNSVGLGILNGGDGKKKHR